MTMTPSDMWLIWVPHQECPFFPEPEPRASKLGEFVCKILYPCLLLPGTLKNASKPSHVLGTLTFSFLTLSSRLSNLAAASVQKNFRWRGIRGSLGWGRLQVRGSYLVFFLQCHHHDAHNKMSPSTHKRNRTWFDSLCDQNCTGRLTNLYRWPVFSPSELGQDSSLPPPPPQIIPLLNFPLAQNLGRHLASQKILYWGWRWASVFQGSLSRSTLSSDWQTYNWTYRLVFLFLQ